MTSKRINIDNPRWDQSTFAGRFKHFFAITNPLKIFKTNQELDEAKGIVDSYRQGKEPLNISIDQLWNAKHLVDSAFHPDSGERMNVFGRMACQLPAGMLIGGALLYWYKTTPQILFWQWINQSYNALANYTNRNANTNITKGQIGLAYFTATTGAVTVSMLFKSLVKKAPPLFTRFVPFVGVAAANWINVPLMRQREIFDGVEVTDVDGNVLGVSKKAPLTGISQVVISRISMTIPTLLLLPVIMEKIERIPSMKRMIPYNGWIQTAAVGAFLVVMVPAGCALFPQKCSIKVSHLEPELQERIRKRGGPVVDRVYFNKGL